MSDYYGWISKDKSGSISKRTSGTDTDTGSYFMQYLKDSGLIKSIKHRSKNLLVKDDNKYYYVLSIGKNKTTWAPYPFIDEIEDLTFILTQDTENEKGNVWIIRKTEGERGYLNGIPLKHNQRDNGGNYYSLNKNQIKGLRNNGNKDDPDFTFDKNQIKTIKKIVEEILKI